MAPRARDRQQSQVSSKPRSNYDPKEDSKLLASGPSLKHNAKVVAFWRIVCSAICGSAVGVLGVYGWHGFLYYIVAHFTTTFPLLVKAGMTPSKYFYSWSAIWLDHLASQLTILTFIIFWIIFYNVTHVF